MTTTATIAIIENFIRSPLRYPPPLALFTRRTKEERIRHILLRTILGAGLLTKMAD